MMFIWMIVGAIIFGAVFERFEFTLLGGFLGYLLSLIFKLKGQLGGLTQELSHLQQKIEVILNNQNKFDNRFEKPINNQAVSKSAEQNQAQNLENDLIEESKLSISKAVFKSKEELLENQELSNQEITKQDKQPEQSKVPPLKSVSEAHQASERHSAYNERSSRSASKNNEPDLISKLISNVIGYFTEGNVVVRIGVVILFFGVSFLLKYAAENSIISIEYRLSGVVIAAIVLLVFGWKLKDKKQGYGLILQGAAIGILYLSLFSAFRLYKLVPSELAFPLLILFSGLAMTLAVLQNSRALAVFSASGGFLAPVLISTGSGNHVALFSYFAILNIAIFSVAWFKSWRLLNLVGFVFTFVIGIAWGVTKYQATDFATTEPFLILFYLLYTAIALLFANKYQAEIKGYVDSTLIFGLPFIAFTLQVAMVQDYEYGLAWSAFALGAFYLSVAYLIIKRDNQNLRVIAEAFVALGIIFTSLIVPFALDGEWTAATWAIEGAGLIWLGLRQNRWFAKYFGTLIQLVGGVIFISELNYNSSENFYFDAQLLGILFVSIAALFSSYQIWLKKETLKSFESASRFAFLVWGLLWWYFGGFYEIDQFIGGRSLVYYVIGFISVSSIIWHGLESRLKWTAMTNLVWISLPLLAITGLFYILDRSHLFKDAGIILWPISIAIFYGILFRQDRGFRQDKVSLNQLAEKKSYRLFPQALHLISFLLLVVISFVEMNWLLENKMIAHTAWGIAVYGMLGCAWTMAIVKLKKWPVVQYQKSYAIQALSILMVGLVLWSLFFNFSDDGSANPLGYLPILNPLDIVQFLVVFCLYQAIIVQQQLSVNYSAALLKSTSIGFGFIWLNIILLRSIHAWANIVYDPQVMFNSVLVQTSVSIFWTVLGLMGTIAATKIASRKVWIYSAGLIGVVVFKLFVIDLDNSSSIERIVSFVVVGLLLLIVGYFSPLPPKNGAQQQ